MSENDCFKLKVASLQLKGEAAGQIGQIKALGAGMALWGSLCRGRSR